MTPRSKIGAWMKFYPQDWLASTTSSGLTLAEQGAYIRLLCIAWEHGGIPADTRRLATALGVSRQEFGEMWETLREKWSPHPDDPKLLVNPRQERERSEALHQIDAGKARMAHLSPEQRSEMGRAAADARWSMPAECQPDASRNASQHASTMRGTQDSDTQDSDTQDSDTQDSDTQGSVPTTQDPNSAPPERPARARAKDPGSKRISGPAELREGLLAYESHIAAPLRSDLLDAAERYRKRRVDLKARPWRSDQWLAVFKSAGHDQSRLIRALLDADRFGWLSVHPDKKSAREAPRRPDALASLDEKIRQSKERDA